MQPVYITLGGDNLTDDLIRLELIQKRDKAGNSELHLLADVATKVGSWAHLAHELIDRGSDVNAMNTIGQTALHRASARGNAELVQALLERGGNWSIPDGEGISAWERAWYKQGSETLDTMKAWVRQKALRGVLGTEQRFSGESTAQSCEPIETEKRYF